MSQWENKKGETAQIKHKQSNRIRTYDKDRQHKQTTDTHLQQQAIRQHSHRRSNKVDMGNSTTLPQRHDGPGHASTTGNRAKRGNQNTWQRQRIRVCQLQAQQTSCTRQSRGKTSIRVRRRPVAKWARRTSHRHVIRNGSDNSLGLEAPIKVLGRSVNSRKLHPQQNANKCKPEQHVPIRNAIQETSRPPQSATYRGEVHSVEAQQ